MNAVIDSLVEPTPTKPTRTRATRKTAASTPRSRGDRTPKSADPSLVKSSFYLPVEVAKKLTVAGVIRGQDMSDIVAEILGRELSSVTFYDKPSRTPNQTLTVTEIGETAAA